MSVETFDRGDEITIEASFADPDDGSPLDPADVRIFLLKPNGAQVEVPTVVQDSAGHYHADYLIDQSGQWKYRIVATGGPTAAEEGRFKVRSTAFVSPAV